MSLPALPSTTDIRSITERVNAIIKQIYNKMIPVGADNYVLTSDGTTLAWEALPAGAITNTGATTFLTGDVYNGATGISIAYYTAGGIDFGSSGALRWGTSPNTSVDLIVARSAASVLGLYGASLSVGSSLALASDKVVGWSTTTDPDGTVGPIVGPIGSSGWSIRFVDDGVSLHRSGVNANDLLVANDGNYATIGGLLAGIRVTAVASGTTASDVYSSRKCWTNEGASGEITFNLPGAATTTASSDFIYYVHTAQSLKIVAAAGDTIRVAAGVSATGGYVRCATAGAIVRLFCVNATEWVAMYQTGVWTVDV